MQYAFIGHKNVERYVKDALADLDWEQSDDLANCSVAFTYCTAQTALEDAYFSDKGLVKGLPSGSLMIDLSPSTPTFARELSAIAAVNDLRPVEAPLVVVDSTLDNAFVRDNLACFASGDAHDVEEALEVLDVLFASATDMGACGCAQLARAAFTLQMTAQIVGAIEAAALYKAVQGASTSVDHMEGTPGGVTATSAELLRAVAEERFAGTYTVEMLLGEVSAAMAAADDVELILPQVEASMHLFEILAVIGGADLAPAGVSLVFESEDVCAEHDLDWARAEQYYSHAEDDCDCDGDCGDDCACGHHHREENAYDDYNGYSDYDGGFPPMSGFSSN